MYNTLGLTGIDGKVKSNVSMRGVVSITSHIKLTQCINGNDGLPIILPKAWTLTLSLRRKREEEEEEGADALRLAA